MTDEHQESLALAMLKIMKNNPALFESDNVWDFFKVDDSLGISEFQTIIAKFAPSFNQATAAFARAKDIYTNENETAYPMVAIRGILRQLDIFKTLLYSKEGRPFNPNENRDMAQNLNNYVIPKFKEIILELTNGEVDLDNN